jgi:hypothetical protein
VATCATLLADLNDRLNDPGNSQAGEELKIGWLNSGIAAMWPKIYRTVRDSTLTIASNTYEYNVPSAVGANTKILRVEVETGSATGRYVDVSGADIVPGLTDPILVFREGLPGAAGSKIRITAAKMLTPFTTSASTYDGPTGSEELPVLYAMGIACSRRIDDRVDHRRYNSTQNQAGIVTINEMMDVSQFWFSQFELILERQAMPLPSPAG